MINEVIVISLIHETGLLLINISCLERLILNFLYLKICAVPDVGRGAGGPEPLKKSQKYRAS